MMIVIVRKNGREIGRFSKPYGVPFRDCTRLAFSWDGPTLPPRD